MGQWNQFHNIERKCGRTIYFITKPRRLDPTDTSGKVVNGSFLVPWITANDIPQSSRLDEIVVLNAAAIGCDFTNPLLVLSVQAQRLRADSFDLGVEFGRLKRGIYVVWITTVVVVKSHFSISLERTVYRNLSCVSWKLLVVDTKSVASCIRISK